MNNTERLRMSVEVDAAACTAPGGVPGPGGGVGCTWSRGGVPGQVPPPPVDRMTYMCKNITFANFARKIF